MPRIAKKDKIDDFINEENINEVKSTTTKRTSKVASESAL